MIGEPALIWGHSIGACVALKLAADHGSLASAIVVEDLPLQSGIPNEDILNLFKFWLEFGRSEMSEEAMVSEMVGNLGPEELEVYRYKAKTLRQMDLHLIELAMDGNLWKRSDALGHISKIRCPAFLMQADPDVGGLINEDLSALSELQRENWTWKKYKEISHNMHSLFPELIADNALRFFSSLVK